MKTFILLITLVFLAGCASSASQVERRDATINLTGISAEGAFFGSSAQKEKALKQFVPVKLQKVDNDKK